MTSKRTKLSKATQVNNNNDNNKELNDESLDLEKAFKLIDTGKHEDGSPVLFMEGFALMRKILAYLLGLELEKEKLMKEIWDSDANAMEQMAKERQYLEEKIKREEEKRGGGG